jgi:hypothetical protein
MKCFSCENPVFDMVQISDCYLICPHCDMKFDIEHAEYTEKDLIMHGYFYMSNEPLADQWRDYFIRKYPKLKLIKYGISQWFYIDDRGRTIVEIQFLKMKENLEKELNSVRSILRELEE